MTRDAHDAVTLTLPELPPAHQPTIRHDVNVRLMPAAQFGRIETGPVQFGSDWPGLFIRGDDAMFYMMALTGVLDTCGDSLDTAGYLVINGMIERLRECQLSTADRRVVRGR